MSSAMRTKLATELLPPELTNGRFIPVIGVNPRFMPMLINICVAIMATTPTASNRPKGSEVRADISNPLTMMIK